MRQSRLLLGMVALNLALLAGLLWKLTPENPAQAQPMGRADFIMVPADIPGAPSGAVYMVDTTNALLSGFVYEHNRGTIEVMAPIDIGRLFAGGRP